MIDPKSLFLSNQSTSLLITIRTQTTSAIKTMILPHLTTQSQSKLNLIKLKKKSHKPKAKKPKISVNTSAKKLSKSWKLESTTKNSTRFLPNLERIQKKWSTKCWKSRIIWLVQRPYKCLLKQTMEQAKCSRNSWNGFCKKSTSDMPSMKEPWRTWKDILSSRIKWFLTFLKTDDSYYIKFFYAFFFFFFFIEFKFALKFSFFIKKYQISKYNF